jgi:polar amino acid transport system permease protein
MIFDVDYAARILPDLLEGTAVTLIATLVGMALALTLGLFVAIARRSSVGAVSWAAATYTEVIRDTPFLIQLFFLFYVLPGLGVTLTPEVTGVVGLGVYYSSYLAEVYRAGIEGVPEGQWDAALALHFSRRRTWIGIILPQAFRRSLPALGNYLLSMFKDTPLLSVIGVRELLGSALHEAGVTFRYLEPVTLVGLIFLGLSLPFGYLVRRLETRLAVS